MDFIKQCGLIWLVISVLSLTACDRPADITSPKQYDQNQIQLSYPGNWKITEEESDDDFSYLAIEGGDALMVLQLYAKAEALSLEEFAKVFSESTKEALPIGEIVDIEFLSAKRNIQSELSTGTKELFSIKLWGESIPHVREYYTIESKEKVLFIISHIPIDTLPLAEPGFKLVYETVMIK